MLVDLDLYEVRTYLPIVPALGIDHPPILESHKELATLISDVDQTIDEFMDVLQKGNLHSSLRFQSVVMNALINLQRIRIPGRHCRVKGQTMIFRDGKVNEGSGPGSPSLAQGYGQN